ncbi:AraC family transcriptional regulator, partial [Acinetobacter baumannii]
MAAVAQLSVHHFLSAFRNCFGVTPMQFVIGKRLALASSLLAGTRQDITAIALATGFASHSHFTGAFKQRYGITPRQ